jgi:hypothetical protein
VPRSAARRRWLGAAFAVAAGLAIAWVDSRPGFDATGMTVTALVLAASLAVIIGGIRTFGWALVLGCLAGVWVALLELRGAPGAASLAALVFALAGALGGAAALRTLSR